jgi:hypothetical protein
MAGAEYQIVLLSQFGTLYGSKTTLALKAALLETLFVQLSKC